MEYPPPLKRGTLKGNKFSTAFQQINIFKNSPLGIENVLHEKMTIHADKGGTRRGMDNRIPGYMEYGII